MLLFYHISTAFLLMGVNKIILGIQGVNTRNSEGYLKSTFFFSLLYFTVFNFTMIWFKVNWIIYVHMLMSIVHTFIHASKTKITVVERADYSLDELWHFANYAMNLYYLHTNEKVNQNNIIYYDILYTLYFALVIFFAIGKSLDLNLNNKKITAFIYYTGAVASAWFDYSITIQPFWQFIAYMLMYMPVVSIVTLDNVIGRKFLDLNVAGAGFLAESITLHMAYNRVY